jgi:hypothetical protein
MNKELRNIDLEYIRKKRTALFDLLDNKNGYHTDVLRWYWIGRDIQMIESSIIESFCNNHLNNYQYHILYKWSRELEKYVNDRMVEEM